MGNINILIAIHLTRSINLCSH